MTLPGGGQSAASAREFAAVALGTQRARTSVSNSTEKRSSSWALQRSPAEAVSSELASAIAASTGGQTGAALSEKKRMAADVRRWRARVNRWRRAPGAHGGKIIDRKSVV